MALEHPVRRPSRRVLQPDGLVARWSCRLMWRPAFYRLATISRRRPSVNGHRASDTLLQSPSSTVRHAGRPTRTPVFYRPATMPQRRPSLTPKPGRLRETRWTNVIHGLSLGEHQACLFSQAQADSTETPRPVGGKEAHKGHF
jgi:hypothetical protein